MASPVFSPSTKANGSLSPLQKAEMIAKVSREVERVGEIILEVGESRSPMVERVIRHTLAGGGKRLRPAFVLLAARAVNPNVDRERLYRLGACMEMVHMATLVHDDVVDNSAKRRGRATAAVTFGNTASILSGDVLLAKAMELLADDGDLGIIRTVARAVVEMAEGEVRELELRGDFDLSREAHLEVLRMKTAAFIRCCCEIGARAAGADAATIAAFSAYGEEIGLAFQIVDDLLDYRGDSAKTGKPIATDFREGQATLPIIYLRERLSPAEGAVARQRFGAGTDEKGPSDDEMRMIGEWMASRGAFVRAEADAVALVGSAKGRLAGVPKSVSRDALAAIADYVLTRQG